MATPDPAQLDALADEVDVVVGLLAEGLGAAGHVVCNGHPATWSVEAHEAGGAGFCGSCRTAWPCEAAEAVLAVLPALSAACRAVGVDERVLFEGGHHRPVLRVISRGHG